MSQDAKVSESQESAAEKIARLERELESALELATDMQRGLDSYMADHSRLEAERARLASENDGLRESSGLRRLAALLGRFMAEHDTYPGDLPCSCDLCATTRAALAEVKP